MKMMSGCRDKRIKLSRSGSSKARRRCSSDCDCGKLRKVDRVDEKALILKTCRPMREKYIDTNIAV